MIVDSTQVPLDPNLKEFWYNSLDCAVTLEIAQLLLPKPEGQNIYAFQRALQGPALEMMLHGWRVDEFWRQWNIKRLDREIDNLQEALDRLAHGVWGQGLNPNSPKQKLEFFYEVMKFPEQFHMDKGQRRVATGREQLEKLLPYYLANPFVNLCLEIVDRRKMRGTLLSAVDDDGMMRCTYNVCGTETGRWASRKAVNGKGTNLMNISEEIRRMFIADPGYILVALDGEQAESKAVGLIQGMYCNDWQYLDACEEGDLHTKVAQLVWPDMKWSNDPEENKEIAGALFYRHFTYRFMAKRGGHLTNYYGGPWMMAKSLKIPTKLADDFQNRYAKGPDPAFPGFRKWWDWVNAQLASKSQMTTFVGRTRTFFGRPNDDATLREAIAYEPQSAVGDLINEGGLRVWTKFPIAVPLGQNYDSYVFQIPEDRLDLVEPMKKTFEVPVTSKCGRTMTIPAEAKVGWNWCSADPKKEMFSDGNPDGLVKWKGSDQRRRTEDPKGSLLDRIIP